MHIHFHIHTHITYDMISLSFQQALVKPYEWTGAPPALGLRSCIGPARADGDSSADAIGKPASIVDIEAMQKQIADLTSRINFFDGVKDKPDSSNSTNAEVGSVGDIHPAATASPLYISPGLMAQVSQPIVVGTKTVAAANNAFDTVTSPIETIGQGHSCTPLEYFYLICIPCSKRLLMNVFLDSDSESPTTRGMGSPIGASPPSPPSSLLI